MEPEAPPRFSTMTGWPSCFVSCAARMRATWSTDPPGGKTAISLIGFTGHKFCARAPGETAASIAAASAKKKARFIDPPLTRRFPAKAKLYPKKVLALHRPVLAFLLDRRTVATGGNMKRALPRFFLLAPLFLILGLAAALPAAPAAPTAAPTTPAADPAAYQHLIDAANAVVAVKTKALANARSNRTLGAERTGSGGVIAPSGLVLTI